MVKIRLPLLDLGALFVFIASIAGFMFVEILPSGRFILFALAAIAAILAWTNRDRVLWALTTIYASSASLLTLLLTEVLPSWVVFPILSIVTIFLFVWLTRPTGAASDERQSWLAGLGISILLVEVIWFLSYWSFDPKSKAAITSLAFYALWSLWRGPKLGERLSLKEWLAAGIWLLLVLLFVLWFAEWYA